MIGFLNGTLRASDAPFLLIDVQGVGYEVEVASSTLFNLPQLGEPLMLFTHLVVRDDAHLLFGFLTEPDRLLFRTLIKVNGVGAKLALTILSGMTVDELHFSVENNDTGPLVRVPGIGKKTAERLIVELRDRLPKLDGIVAANGVAGGQSNSVGEVQEAISALISLGYKPQEATKMVRAIDAEGLNSGSIIRLALQQVGK
ncbi:MAG: Holliday junction branch migration protein RuvA [Gammaproteobacteria bacterium]|nr:MAG: Holliday junction branch migration protein RuvA [Gammaproteobacteria bacterium]RLA19488.1 MAG: Holliday junction branch migration protein RuvA [Gammaproteobacteria bacterium]